MEPEQHEAWLVERTDVPLNLMEATLSNCMKNVHQQHVFKSYATVQQQVYGSGILGVDGACDEALSLCV